MAFAMSQEFPSRWILLLLCQAVFCLIDFQISSEISCLQKALPLYLCIPKPDFHALCAVLSEFGAERGRQLSDTSIVLSPISLVLVHFKQLQG